MNVKFKYLSICFIILFIQFNSNRGHVSKYLNKLSSGDARIKRQAGYVYDKPTVTFDLPRLTSITTTQAPTVDRIQMQMYYAYPVPAVGAGDVNIGQQNTGASSGSTAAVSSGANGYSYGSSTLTDTQSSGYQNARVTGTQVVTSGTNGYGDGRPTSVSTTSSTGGTVSTNAAQTPNSVNSGYQYSGVTGTQAVVSSGSTGYGDGRPTSVSTIGSTRGSISTNARRYLPPTTSGESTVGVSVTATNQAQTGSTITQPSESYIPQNAQVPTSQNDQSVTIGSTITQPSESYIPQNAQVPTSQNEQSVTITQSAANTQSPPINPNVSYLQPLSQSAPKVTIQKEMAQSVPVVLTQQYLPPIETPTGQKTIQGFISTPASTYLPPVF